MTSAVSTTAFSGVRINSFKVSTKFGCGTVPSSSWVGNVQGIVMRHVHLLVAIAKLI